MSKILPRDIQLEIKNTIYEMADAHHYMNRGRIENGIFINNLTKHPEVGDILLQYMTKSEIRTYIKDAVLNRYAKDKKQEELSSKDESSIIAETFGQDANLIEKRNGVSFYRLEHMDYLLISCGTFVKWETALRKALEYISNAPGLPPQNNKLHILLNLALAGRILTDADKDHLAKSLDFIGLKVFINGSHRNLENA